MVKPAREMISVAAWLLLVAVAVAGRLWQPSWHGEPLWHATPLAALAISNLALPAYGTPGVAAVVYAATAWPVLLGGSGLLGRERPRWLAVLGGSLVSSLVFFGSTNLAHWACTSDYPHTAAGLAACFAAALPFYRWMPLGDAAWTLATFAAIVAIRSGAEAVLAPRLRPSPVSTRPLD